MSTSITNKKAFTLIEVLVVVLVIGILAAIALPQYQLAVEKTRAAEAINILRSLNSFIKIYALEKGEIPSNLENLAMDMPGTCYTLDTLICDTKFFNYRIISSYVLMRRIPNRYSFQLHFHNIHNSGRNPSLSCIVPQENSFYQKICKALSGKENPDATAYGSDYYSVPF